MSNIKDICCSPRLQGFVLASWMATMLHDVIVVHHRWAHTPVIHAASHFYHEKRVAWVSISKHACDPVPIVTGLRLAACRVTGALL